MDTEETIMDNEEPSDDEVMNPPKAKKVKDCKALVPKPASSEVRKKRQWDLLSKRAQTWKSLFTEKEEPSFVCMALVGNQVRFEAPQHMEGFCRDPDVIAKFKQHCVQRGLSFRNEGKSEVQNVKKTEKKNTLPAPICLPSLDPKTYEWQGLCIIIPRIVKHFYNTDDRKVWSNFTAPEWWPGDVAFKSPNNARDGIARQSVGNMQRVLQHYFEKCNDYYTTQPQQDSLVQNQDEDVKELDPPVQNTESGENKKEHNVQQESGHEDSNTLLTNDPQATNLPKDLKEMDLLAKRILGRCIRKKPNDEPEVDAEFVMSSWIENNFIVPIPKTFPTDLGKVDRRYHNCSFDGTVYKSTGQGDCLYCSISLLLYGTEAGKHLLRLASLVAGITHVPHLIQQTVSLMNSIDDAVAFVMSVTNEGAIHYRPNNNPTIEQLVSWTYRCEILECGRIYAYSGLLQVQFLSTALNIPIQQHCLEAMDIYEGCVGPCVCLQGNAAPLHILWNRLNKNGKLNHIQPIVFNEEVEVAAAGPTTLTSMFGSAHKCIMLFSAMCSGGDSWVQCDNCSMWAHTMCVGMPDDNSHIRFACCGTLKDDPVILTWPKKMNKPKIHQQSETLKLSDIQSLFDGNGVSDAIINFYLRYILQEDIKERILLCSTRLTQELFNSIKENSYNAAVLKERHLKNDLVADKKVMVFPLCITETWHWVLAIACIESRRIFIMDSAGGNNTPKKAIQTGISAFIDDLLKEELKPAVHLNDICIAKVPTQEGVDCGVHVLENAKRLFEKHSVEVLSLQREITISHKKKGQKIRASILCVISALSTADNI